MINRRSEGDAHAGWPGRATQLRRVEGGFTLIELLIVAVIIPLIVGAIAAGVIAIEQNSGTTGNRLADSQNATVSSAYFQRDVQGAEYVTTDASAASAGGTAVSVCGSGSTLLLGLYRPGSTGVSLLDIGYWATTVNKSFEAVRDVCSSSGSVTNNTVLSDDLSASAVSPASITPSQFGSSAAAGWTPTSAATTLVQTADLPTGTLNVASTNGFSITSPLDVLTSTGYLSITCTATTASTFTGCACTSQTCSPTTAPQGFSVTQPANVGGVELTVAQPNSNYTFSLTAVPRAWSSLASGSSSNTNPLSVPVLLTLGSGVGVQGGRNSDLTVDGVISLNSGELTCTGGPDVTAYGYEATGGSTAISPAACATGGPTVTAPAIPDPLKPFLPSYPTGFPSLPTNPGTVAVGGETACQPGTYTEALPCSYLEPGIYVVEDGLQLGNGSLAMASNAGTNGVLLYLRSSSACSPKCSLDMRGNGTLDLTPLTSSQAASDFGSTAMGGVLIWQDASDSDPDSFGGTPSGATLGTLYMPSAAVTFQGNSAAVVGRIIAASVSLAGSTPLTITGS